MLPVSTVGLNRTAQEDYYDRNTDFNPFSLKT